MDLPKLKEDNCTHCGSEMVSEGRKNQHSNGQWNEYRTFRCGRSIRYSPNFSSVCVETECPKEPENAAFVLARENSLNKLHGYIDKMKVDDKFKGKLRDTIRYV